MKITDKTTGETDSRTFKHYRNKHEIYFYKGWQLGFRMVDLIPIVRFTKNVQGWSFTRVWSFNWFTYVMSFVYIKISHLNEDRSIAHDKNVKRYITRRKVNAELVITD